MHSVNKLVSTFFGIGYFPYAPGTLAAALTTVIWYFSIERFPDSLTWQLLSVSVIVLGGIYCSGKLTTGKSKDPSYVVIDEVAGMLISLLFIPFTVKNFLLAFILFRFFDIAKPLGIRQAEKARGGLGIMLDDVLAGIYSNITLRLLILL